MVVAGRKYAQLQTEMIDLYRRHHKLQDEHIDLLNAHNKLLEWAKQYIEEVNDIHQYFMKAKGTWETVKCPN